jgi:hypothetical protein
MMDERWTGMMGERWTGMMGERWTRMMGERQTGMMGEPGAAPREGGQHEWDHRGFPERHVDHAPGVGRLAVRRRRGSERAA